jgi:hypothetical protein
VNLVVTKEIEIDPGGDTDRTVVAGVINVGVARGFA